VTRYLGIPYAVTPAGGHRFAAPAPTEPWTGTREARDHGATAPQPALHPANAHLAPLVGPGWIRGDGQYLNLNVWTPDTGTRGLPVMVCIHGYQTMRIGERPRRDTTEAPSG
jgi:para-nitrobenzyl esterase